MTYQHLPPGERYQIDALQLHKVSITCIAVELVRNRTTITRELLRNARPKCYKAAQAHRSAPAR